MFEQKIGNSGACQSAWMQTATLKEVQKCSFMKPMVFIIM